MAIGHFLTRFVQIRYRSPEAPSDEIDFIIVFMMVMQTLRRLSQNKFYAVFVSF